MNLDHAALAEYLKQFTENDLKDHKVNKKTAKTTGGNISVTAKVSDRYNFINHPTVAYDIARKNVTDLFCDCADYRQKRTCVHCAVLILDENLVLGSPALFGDGQSIAGTVLNAPFDDGLKDNAYPDISDKEEMRSEGSVGDAAADNELPEDISEEKSSMEICLGTDTETDEPVLWYPNDTEKMFHINTGIIGTMGTGKTQFTKSLITQLRLERANNYDGTDIGILIFDYKGDYNSSKEDFIKAADAVVLKPYKMPYNPFALNISQNSIPLLPIHVANLFKDTLSKIYNLGPIQQNTLFDCIIEAYKKQGIYPDAPNTWINNEPTFEQVYLEYTAQTGKTNDSLGAVMAKLHHFCIFENDVNRTFSLHDLLKGVVVLDLSGYDDDIKSLVAAITLDQFYAQMKAYGSSKTDGRLRQIKNIILIDEADDIMSGNFPSLKKIMKEGREFGVGVILSTQSLSHFVKNGDDYSRYILTWVIHNVNDLSKRNVEYVMKFNDQSCDTAEIYGTIKELNKHESVIKLSDNRPIKMRDKAFWQLYQEIVQGGK